VLGGAFLSVAHITQLTALQQLDAEYERVADSMGVPFWTLLWRVHLPVCLPAVMQVAGYFFVNAMTTVSAVVFCTRPKPRWPRWPCWPWMTRATSLPPPPWPR
jgi:iron(III) transport system permease protein